MDEIKIQLEVPDSIDECDPLQKPNHDTHCKNMCLVEYSPLSNKVEAVPRNENAEATKSQASDAKKLRYVTCTNKRSVAQDAVVDTGTGQKQFPCDICSRAFSRKSNMKQHVRIKHEKKSGSLQNLKFTDDIGVQLRNDSLMKIDPLLEKDYGTKSKFDEAAMLDNDVPTNHGEKQCYIQTKTKTNKTSKNENQHCDRRLWPFACDFCDSRFTLKKNLFRHRHIQHVFPCGSCRGKFITTIELSQHIRKRHPRNCLPNHPNSEIIDIEDDSRDDSSQTDVKRIDGPSHLELIPVVPPGNNMMAKNRNPDDEVVDDSSNNTKQPGIGPQETKKLREVKPDNHWVCKLCGRKDKGRIKFKEHMAVHDGGKPFACDSCSFESHLSSRLLHHKRVWHKINLFTCKLCDYKTSKKKTFKWHHENNHVLRCMGCDFRSNTVEEVSQHYSKTHLR